MHGCKMSPKINQAVFSWSNFLLQLFRRKTPKHFFRLFHVRLPSAQRGINQRLLCTHLSPSFYLEESQQTGGPLPPRSCAYAAEACPRYAGTKTSCTNVSNEVGVLFPGERASSGASTPSLTAVNISIYTAAFFGENPICVNAC